MGIKILLADDSVTAQNMGKKILSEAGHEVVTVSNGAAAAKKIAEIKPELVLLDVFMPGYSGLELCERLRNAAETSKLPVLLTVGRMEPYSPNDGTRVKADGVIVKPFEASDLTAAVDRLAEKIKGEKQPEPERAMKIVPRQESRIENSSAPAEHPQSPSANGAKLQSDREELPYEKTQRLDPSHIAAILNKSEASKPEDTTPLTVVPEPEFDMSGPVHSAEVQHESVNQGLEAEQSRFGERRNEAGLKEPERRFAVPSYMTQYLADHPGLDAEPASDATGAHAPAAPAKPASEEPSSAFAVSNDVLHHSHSEIDVDPPVASATGLELTAAAPAPDQPVAIAPGFEPTLQSSEHEAPIAKDPALVTDLHHASMDFPTRFGTADPELADFLVQASQESDKSASSSGDSADEFEARLNAALSSYEAPAADLPMVAPEMDAPTAAFAPYRAPESPSITDDFEVEGARHGFESPAAEPGLESQPSSYQLPTEPGLEVIGLEPDESVELLEIRNDVDPELVSEPDPISPQSSASSVPQEDETASIEVISDAVADPFEAATSVHTLGADAAPEPDDAVIEQMRSSFSHLPAEPIHMVGNAHPEPMAFAAAASTTSTSGSSLAPEPDAEVARAIAAALAQESLGEGHTLATPEPIPAHRSDVSHLAGAVEKIMKQELPSLVWKIMAELDLRKR